MIGGDELAHLFLINQKGDPSILKNIYHSILSNPEIVAQRKHIESQQVIDIHSWVNQWKDKWLSV
jgi:hypothetical protein